jgi:hypothetical protein
MGKLQSKIAPTARTTQRHITSVTCYCLNLRYQEESIRGRTYNSGISYDRIRHDQCTQERNEQEISTLWAWDPRSGGVKVPLRTIHSTCRAWGMACAQPRYNFRNVRTFIVQSSTQYSKKMVLTGKRQKR